MGMSLRTLEISDPSLSPPGLQFVTVKSRALRQRADVTIYLPPEFHQRRDLPIVTLLHGVYGSHWAWTYKGAAHLTAADLMCQGAIRPMVLVMPSDGLWGDGSGYVAHQHQDFERWVVKEVPELALRACTACSSDSPRFIAGLSMGGFAALRLAGQYPTVYKAASAHSALTDLSQIDALIEESRAHWASEPSNTSVLEALRGARQLPALRLDCGKSDALLNANRQLHQSLLDLGIAHDYEEFEGGHDWHYWRNHLANSLRFFSRTLEQLPHD
jgi:putative tributyrin esterase